jgi:hypothetical protein
MKAVGGRGASGVGLELVLLAEDCLRFVSGDSDSVFSSLSRSFLFLEEACTGGFASSAVDELDSESE